MSEIGHSAQALPTPWELDDECETIYSSFGFLIASVMAYYPENKEVQAANARHIVKCVNAHDELVRALQVCEHAIEAGMVEDDLQGALSIIRAALAKVDQL